MAGRSAVFISIVLAVVAVGPVATAQEFQPPASGWSPRALAFPWGSALQGVHIAVSPGHGWLIADGAFQRDPWRWDFCGGCDAIVEDLLNAETCADHLVPLLRQAGAKVHVARELDRQAHEVVLDDGDAGYAEQGPWQAGATAGLGYGGTYRALHAPAGGAAVWSVEVPAAGDYWVQVRYAAGPNRCPDARFGVVHAGGRSDFEVDQRRDGSTWVYLARLGFEAGPASVVVEAPAQGDCYVIADAVRLGGGVDGATGLPRWQMGAVHWLPFAGAAGIEGQGDVTVRPVWANGIGADLFVSLHANAGGATTSSGTSTYRYNCGTGVRWQPLDPAACDQPPGSAALQSSVQDRIVQDLRAEWDPAWNDGGDLVANFGELRPLDGIPGFLVEAAFFDGVAAAPGHRYPDNRSLHDPRFRHLLARGVARAIQDVLAPGTPFPPEPPTHLALRNDGAGSLLASWRPVPTARGYRVYVALGGRGFDGGTVVQGTSLGLPLSGDGTPVFVRVSSLNEGGESPASEAVGARRRVDGGPADVLLVNGFDRVDAWVREDANHHDYAVDHGRAIAGAAAGGWAFDGASNEAIVDGDVSLEPYRVVDWILGRESSESEALSDAEQARAAAFLDRGGCLLASGTEVAWDLGALGADSDRAFLGDRLGAAFVDDDAGTRQVDAAADGPLQGVPAFAFDDGTGGTYDAKYPDVLAPAAGARSILHYAGGAVAGVSRDQGAGRSILLGFPFETVVDRGAAGLLMERMLAFCGTPTPPGASVGDGDDDAATVGDIAILDEGPSSDDAGPDLAVPADLQADPDVPDAGADARDATVPGADDACASDVPAGDGALPESVGRAGGGCAGGRGTAAGPACLVLAGLALALGFRRGQRPASSTQRSSAWGSSPLQGPSSPSGPSDRSR